MSYSVGQVSALAGITVRTLHHYDELGLLTPSERGSAGYRRYSDVDLERLEQILYYRELGFSLTDIATIVNKPTTDAGWRLLIRTKLAGLIRTLAWEISYFRADLVTNGSADSSVSCCPNA